MTVTEVPAEGQDEEELEHPAPSFEILPASAEGDHHGEAAEARMGSYGMKVCAEAGDIKVDDEVSG